MKDYELIIESTNPCGGTEYAQRDFMEISTEDPIAYVKTMAQVQEVELISRQPGKLILQTGKNGYIKRYYFEEC